MKVTKAISCLAAVGCVAVVAGSAMAEEAAPSLSTRLDVAYLNKYVWRGLVLNPEPVIQPSLTLSFPSGFSYNLWLSANAKDGAAGGSGEVVENDHTFNYSFSAGKVAVNTGYIYYAFPNTTFLSTSEVYGSANFGGKFSPTVSVNYDMDEFRGAYGTLSGGYCCGLPFSKSTTTSMNLSAKVGFGTAGYVTRTYVGAPDKAALLDLVVGASSTFSLGGHYSVTPTISYSKVLDNNVRKVLVDPDNLVAGLTVTSSF